MTLTKFVTGITPLQRTHCLPFYCTPIAMGAAGSLA